MARANQNKGIRQPTTGKAKKGVRADIGRQIQLDSEIYERLYPDKTLMKINDLNGDVQKWIDAGAEPVPARIPDRKVYAGINDKRTSEWVTWIGGTTDAGKEYLVYLLMMDPELYEEVKNRPQRARQEEIQRAMKIGGDASGENPHLPGGGGIQTYAPNLPTGGGQGFNQIRPQHQE